ncbi:Uma2 family endonuclease [Streptomyces sp. B-S-A8]|uniref:Uma2 family endonuclease n=1 Tax=Streptomyces solicavernae TaxID=3043614 RepID=A0ABT6RUN4_9ACTN|nr:Uma2 family endonuclease [Streptomyces sp. B-S-A8]MDI3388143.1 Uma2 family endonuclease [Streptomyces sp. B-S-A8]
MTRTGAERLDELFDVIEQGIPEGYKAEVVEGAIHAVPQRDSHWQITLLILRAVDAGFGRATLVMSDVRIDFPGFLNGFCPDVAKLRDDAEPDRDGRWRHQDVEFIAEVVSPGTGLNDHGPKKGAYAAAEVPVYLIADPYAGRCHICTRPKNGEYRTESKADFGDKVDLTHTPLGLTIDTAKFPRDRK